LRGDPASAALRSSPAGRSATTSEMPRSASATVAAEALPSPAGAVAEDESLAHESAIAEPARKSDTCGPDDGDHKCSGTAHGLVLRRCCHRPMFRHNLWGNQFDDDQNA